MPYTVKNMDTAMKKTACWFAVAGSGQRLNLNSVSLWLIKETEPKEANNFAKVIRQEPGQSKIWSTSN